MDRRGFFGLMGKLFAGAVAAKVVPPEVVKPAPFKVMVYEPSEIVLSAEFPPQTLVHFSNRRGIRTVEWRGEVSFGETVEG